MSSSSHCWVRGSSAAVGSSKSSTSGFITSTDAIATRFFCPPESWYGARSARAPMPSIASVSSTRRSTSSVGKPMLSGPNAISSRTVGENTCASEFWNTKPTRERKPALNCSSSRRSSVTVSPNAVYAPESANSSPSSSFSSVDFPQPFAPSSATFSPRATCSETPSSAGNRPRYA